MANEFNLKIPFPDTNFNSPASLGLDLRSISQGDRQEKISRIARQFEEMLLNTLLKDAFKPPSFSGEESSWMSTMSSMQPTLLSQYLSEQGGLGYGKIIEEQILEKIRQISPDPTAPVPNEKLPLSFSPKPPVSGALSSDFGWRNDPISGEKAFHAGVDFAVPIGTPIQSVSAGQVVFSGQKPGYGNVIEVDHGQGLVSRYAHTAINLLKVGDTVDVGTPIAQSGSSGRSTGPHLHFELRQEGRPIDPGRFFSKV